MEKILPNIERIESFLDVLLSNLHKMEERMEASMYDQALVVGDFDPHLRDSHYLEWPEEVGDIPGSFISFNYYKAMRLRSTTSSAYIRKRYEEASRDMTGNGVIDFLHLIHITRKEALLIQDFVSNRGKFIGTASEQKLLKNFETWVQTAVIQTKRVYKGFETAEQRNSFTTEADDPHTTSQEARRSQAVLKVDLNRQNDAIVKRLEILTRHFSDRGNVFYGKFLDKALKSHGMASSRYSGKTRRSLVEETNAASLDVEEELNRLLVDQERRVKLYRENVDVLLSQIDSRNATRHKIWELSEEGKSMPVSGPGVMTHGIQVRHEEVQHWNHLEEIADVGLMFASAVAETPDDFILKGTHADLSDLLEGDPHSQYLLKTGGTVTGDVEADEGVRFDGVDLDEHRHTGVDGTPRIHGEDIIEGTLEDDIVDLEDAPPKPVNLTPARMDLKVVPPGVAVVDTFMTYDSFDKYIHEMEIRLVPTKPPVPPPVPVVGGEFNLHQYNYAMIIPLPGGRFAVERPKDGLYTGDIVMGVYEIDDAGTITIVDELVCNDLSGVTGGSYYQLVKTGEYRWVFYSPQVDNDILAGFTLDGDTITRADGTAPSSAPGGEFGFPVSMYSPEVDLGIYISTGRNITRIQWREGDSAPAVVDWHVYGYSAPHNNDMMLPRSNGDGTYTLLVEDTAHRKFIFDPANISAATLSEAIDAPLTSFTIEMFDQDVYWQAFEYVNDYTYIARTQPGESVEDLIPFIEGDESYMQASISPEAVREGEILVMTSRDGGGDLYFRTISDPTNLKTLGPDSANYWPVAPGVGLNRIVTSNYSWQAYGMEQYATDGYREEGSHLIFFGWPI